jgi:ribose transport system ATP-binding protein
MVAPLLETRDISKRFGPVEALSHVSLSILPGRVHTLLGENGAGKSTLMKILAGVYVPTSGHILIDGNEVSLHGPQDSRQRGIAIIFQELSLSNNRSVAENIYSNREPRRFGVIDDGKLQRDARTLLNTLEIPIDPTVQVGSLSLGTLIGALTIGVINNGMNLLSVPYFYQLIVKGMVILVAVYVDVLNKKRRA